MTKAQERVVNRIRKDAETMHNSSDFEIKKWEVEETDYGKVILYFEIGLVGDEGTLAQYIGRDKLQIFIGPRGGTKIPCHTQYKSGKFHHFYSKYTNIWSACIAYEGHYKHSGR